MRGLVRVGYSLLLASLLACGDDAEPRADDAAMDSGHSDAESPPYDAASDGQSNSPDADGHDADGHDADGMAPLPTCDLFDELFPGGAACSAADDCVILGSCSGAFWRAVAKRDESEARALHNQVQSCGGFDGPIQEARCEERRCVVVPSGEVCGSFSEDAGTD
jgi:hypothetical protein